MGEYDVPEDLVQLKVAFWAADAECIALSAGPEPTDPRERERARADLDAANAKRLGLIAEMYAHPWWRIQPNRYEADLAVNQAAKAAGGKRP